MAELNISINGRRAISGAKTVVKALGSIGSKAKTLVRSAINPLTAAIGAFAGFQAAKGLISTGDAYTTLAAQLKYVTGSAEGAEQAQSDLYDMSKKTRTSVTANAEALVRLSQANEMTGLTTKGNVRILGGLNALMLKTGTSGASAAAAMTQLTQALASGRLAGDEFKSIAENAPAVMAEFAKSLGVPRGELKQMAADGLITSEVMVQALNNIADGAEESFSELPKTAESGWQLVVNAFERAWDIINDENGIMSYIFDALVNLAEWIEINTPRFSLWAKVLAEKLKTYWPEIKAFFDGFYNGFKQVLSFVYDNWDGFTSFFDNLVNSVLYVKNALTPVFTWLLDKLEIAMRIVAGLGAAAGAISTGNLSGAGEAFTEGYDNPIVGESSLNKDNSGGTTGGTTINNTFNQNLSKNDINDITTQQTRTEGRL